jgi:hypothetical protein
MVYEKYLGLARALLVTDRRSSENGKRKNSVSFLKDQD